MNIHNLLSENICYGPFCSALNASSTNASVGSLFGSTIGKLINWLIAVAGLMTLLYLLWGALDWIFSEGDKEKLHKARMKITHAIIGMLMVIIVLTIWTFITGDLLGIVVKQPDGSWSFSLPSLRP